MKKIILIISLIICFIFNSVSINASEIETTQVNIEEDFPALMIDVYNTVPYKMENGDIIYLPKILDEYPVWAIFKKNEDYGLSACEYITYLADGRIKFGTGLIYAFNDSIDRLYFNGFFSPNNLMRIKGSHSNSIYGAASYYVTGECYSIYNLYDESGNIIRTANLVKVTEEDPDVPVDPEDPDVPLVDNTELTEAIKENNSILNRIYKVLNNLFIMYLFFSLTPYITTLSKRLSGKEFR